MFDRLISQRVTLGGFTNQQEVSQLTVFLGLYNAEQYLESLETQLESQTSTLPIIVVDNQSTDNTWQLVQSWLTKFSGRILLVRNATNLGGTGTLLSNLDLIPSAWVATLHQDDFYKPSHLTTLLTAIKKAKECDLAFATDMGTLDSSGKKSATPPRASWFLPDSSRATMFLSNLRLHNFPFPAGAFRVGALANTFLPWHSTVFPDTELVLKWCLKGNLIHLPFETMLYRENPTSESHSVNVGERELGTYYALTRVVSLPEFQNLLRSLRTNERSKFFHYLIEGLNIRLGNGELSRILKLQVAEICAAIWDYSVSAPNQLILNDAIGVGAARTSSLIQSLSVFYGLDLDEETDSRPPISKVEKKPLTRSRFTLAGAEIIGRLPYRLRKLLGRLLKSRIAAKRASNPWNADWRS
jgi:glycosyltransferase involved in cell wall biosynthesis